ncbi:hypothetical protein BN863_24640 [Formosa agariphila KMM 3901]|uniref:Uncharacterized protein n=1 Tax=Formosa agariphila (strain DSM 15362 / KCTC 12365 / LMG 23005 / KMM 3901 / M-2Alg 35-1) TaxID=1347342 RepID=T2KNZ7_FORAG|nr:hypothetical protein [Formosa agariphila]CDF80176.1 hypothetical protein BN863_24640 [Formosa agariphila KMM 3901]
MKNLEFTPRNARTPSLKSTLKSTFKGGTKVNRIYEDLKTGKLDLLIPESFEESVSSRIKYLLPSPKQITVSFKHCRPVNDQNKIISEKVNAATRPDILTMHNIKIPTGYVPKKIILSYQVYTDAEKSVQINFKVNEKISKKINPSLEAKKTTLNAVNTDAIAYSCFEDLLEFDLNDLSENSIAAAAYLNENNEIPFSLFIRESTHHSFHVSVVCDFQKSTFKHWKTDTCRKLRDKYTFQREQYERKFREQQQQDEHSLLDWI